MDCKCLVDHMRATAPWTCPCECHKRKREPEPEPQFTPEQEERIAEMIAEAREQEAWEDSDGL